MRASNPLSLFTLALILGLAFAPGARGEEPAVASEPASPAALQQAFEKGNFKDAYDGLRKRILDPHTETATIGDDVALALQCLMRLNRLHEADELLESAVKARPRQWRTLEAAATGYMNLPHYGFVIAGKFQRGPHRGGAGGNWVNGIERDRVRSLQLLSQAMPLTGRDDDHAAIARFYQRFAELLQSGRGGNQSWRLQALTDLTSLPDLDQPYGRADQEPAGAAVDPQGNPVYYHVPTSFAAAENDGQRWRWCLSQVVEFDPGYRYQAQLQLADFLINQFGVQTLSRYGLNFGGGESTDHEATEAGLFALATLGDDETIAQLATGVKRFKLPPEFNYIALLKEVAEKAGGSTQIEALAQLAGVYTSRRQYPTAAQWWEKAIAKAEGPQRDQFQAQLQQIVGNWGRFEPTATQPAGKGPTLDYRFRNGRSVTFTAHEIRVAKLLDDVKAYLKSNPKQLDWQKINVGNVGYELVMGNQRQYVGPQVATWSLALEPRAKHFDAHVAVATPLQRAGAYLVQAEMQGGNSSYIILWVADTVLLKKPLDGKTLCYVADAVTGQPVPRANVEFFGYRQEWRDGRYMQVETQDFAEYSDAQGVATTETDDHRSQFQWLIVARTDEGRLAFLGFTNIWTGRWYDAQYNATKVYTITDRPVYRPGQKVHYKFWVRHAQYDQQNGTDFAQQPFLVEIHNPRGEKVLHKTITSDDFGGIEGQLDLPADATLGVYRLIVVGHGGGSFRVEEYKKPEFEVTVDAPAEPVQLGDTISATIKAKYYFGSPVVQAKVKYKVTRSSYQQRWYPWGLWDWLYGPGYWWFAPDYIWYPGWRTWGCLRPEAVWWPHYGRQPPEVISQQEVEIGPDGTVKVQIDTAAAKAVHPDEDHEYTITAEVVDLSRRTIVGTGTVLAARRPFTVTGWVNRGYYRVGDTITAHFAARTLDGKPVAGKGTLQALQVSYRDGKPLETPVQTWDLPTNPEGQAEMSMKATQPGQFRLSYKVTDAKGHTVEGGYLFSITGEGFDGTGLRFNDLELIPDRREYKPGDTVRLMLNTNRPASTVLLFLRPANGIYLPPQALRLHGKSTVCDVAVVQKDMPNFFVEAVTVADGRVHTEVREIIVPPEQRVFDVGVKPSAETYRPGQKASVQLKLTDVHGQPMTGTTVVAVYDKSLEYISGGSNVPEIKAFFWQWRRQHQPHTESSIDRGGYNIDAPGKPGMQDLGQFGGVFFPSGELEQAGFGRFSGALQKHAMLGAVGGTMNGMAFPAEAPMSRAAAAGVAMDAMALKDEAAMPFAAKAATAMAPAAPATAALVQPTVRSQFADTALWVGSLTADQDGLASVSLNMPENLTTWRIKAWALGAGTRVGQGTADVVTRKNLIIRMEAPRFFVETDEVTLSAVVHNDLKAEKSVQAVLELPGKELAAQGGLTQTVMVPAGGERRVDWHVRVAAEGQALIRMKALTDEESDATEQKFPCYVHGMLKTESFAGALRPEQAAGQFTVTVPQQRRPEQTRLEVQFSPTLAGAMVDALPYLADYPYGCTEQTLSRFVPTVITQKVLIEMGLNLDDIRTKRTNLNAQELGDAAQRAAQWKRFDRNPVFDRGEVDKMTKAGVQRLGEMQLSDGGWGWFTGWGEHSSAHMTATVVHGLQIARQNDVAIVPGVLERGVAWLKGYQDQQIALLANAEKKPRPAEFKPYADNLDALVYMVLTDAGQRSPAMLGYLDRDRTRLSVYAVAMFGLALQRQGEREKLSAVLENLRQYVVQDDENQTAWLNLPEGGYWWYWYGSEFETHAYYLKLLCRTEPKGQLAARIAKYLLNNRKHATYWNSTRDTALCIEALADFLRASGEARPEMTVEVWLDGRLEKAVEVTPATLFSFDNRLVIEGEKLAAGKHTVELRRKGRGPLYYNGYLANFTLEDFIARAGLEIKVQRKYYLLEPVEAAVQAAGSRGQAVDQKIQKYRRHELANLAQVKSGQLVEVELAIDAKNDYEYLLFEDFKPAGFETVDVRSGYNGNALGAYVEYRDNRVALFVARLARGTNSVAYRLRAEIPGRFSALPTQAAAMYAPELKANSDEIKLRVED